MTYTFTRRFCAMALAAGSMFCVTNASADTLWTKSGTAAPYKQPEVKILKVEGGKLIYKVVSSDRQAEKPLEEVFQIKLDSDPGFSAAEQAFASEQWEPAAVAYQKVLDSSKLEWQRQRATIRLTESATKAGNFSQMARGYAELIKADPAQAARHKPAIPADKAGSLSGAVAEVDKVMNSSGVSADQKASLTAFKIDLLTANGEREKAAKMIEAATGAATAAPGTTEGAGTVNLRMTAAASAISAKDYAKAIQQLNEAQESITDPAQQVEAFFLRGEAKAGQAKDATANKEAALDYMRAVARAKSANVKTPRVPEALLKTAQLLEKLDAKGEALSLYQQIADEFKGDGPVADQAAASVTRLAAATKGSDK